VCSYGKTLAILVCYDRDKGRDYYSTDWTHLDYTKEQFRSEKPIDKPEGLAEMLDAASRLSKPFPIARIDFYIADGKLYFGEITLTPSSGNHKNLSEYGQMELGKMIPVNDNVI
jgi:hypothetical protein